MEAAPHPTAFAFFARLGSAVLPRIRWANGQLAHVQDVFEPAWLEGLPLPVGEAKAPDQTVALIDGPDFERESDMGAVARAYEDRPRTRVYESLDVRSDGWFSLVSLHLAGLLRRRVICTAYESRAGDRNLGAHVDQWLGVIVQMRGAKRWLIWPTADSSPVEVVTQAGDVLVLPQGMTHQVNTPEDPGYSVHFLFAVTDQLIRPRATPTAPPIDPRPAGVRVTAAAERVCAPSEHD